jgi:predicted transport protein
MSLFSIRNGNLEKIRKIDFKLEKDLQILSEKNLQDIFHLDFVTTEFQLNDLRVDTLAFDSSTNSFVIIEYKKKENFSLIDQSYAYLALLLNNKADFILEYNEKTKGYLQKKAVDWSQSRVIFVSPSFTKYQRRAIEFKDLPFEIWEVTQYSNKTILFNQLKSPDTNESIETFNKTNKTIKTVNKIIKVYEEKDSLENSSDSIKQLYFDLKERIIALGDIEIKHYKTYIEFLSNEYVLGIQAHKTILRIILNLSCKEVDDPKCVSYSIPKNLCFGQGEVAIDLKPDTDLDYIMTLTKQSYKKNS